MNKQPFYHAGQFKSGDKKAIEKAIRSLPTVLKKSIDIIKAETSPIGIGEVLFTATSDVSEEATKALKTHLLILKVVQLIFNQELTKTYPR
jgi:hypothetical protein